MFSTPALWKAADEIEWEAAVLARCVHMLWSAGRNIDALESASAAVALLESLPPRPILAGAKAALAHMLQQTRDMSGAIAAGEAAILHAQRFGDDRTLSWALNACGNAYWLINPDRTVELLIAGLAAARRSGDDLAVTAAMNGLGSGAMELRRYDLADHWLGEAVAWCTERDMHALRGYAMAWRSRSLFEQGNWSEAADLVTEVLGGYSQHTPTRIVALTVLGRLRARRGGPDAQPPLQLAWALAQQTDDLVRLWPVAAARAESAWLSGPPAHIEALVADTYRLAKAAEHQWAPVNWATGGGWPELPPSRPPLLPGPTPSKSPANGGPRPSFGGNWAAPMRRRRRWPAVTIQTSNWQRSKSYSGWARGRPPSCSRAGCVSTESGACPGRPDPRLCTIRPNSPTGRSTSWAYSLTGSPNAEIAARLHISTRTVDHHVSAILAKLDVDSRRKAAQWEAAQRPHQR